MRRRGALRALIALASMTGLGIFTIIVGIIGVVVTFIGGVALAIPGTLVKGGDESGVGFMPSDTSPGALRGMAAFILAMGLGLDGYVYMEWQAKAEVKAYGDSAVAPLQDIIGDWFKVKREGVELHAIEKETDEIYYMELEEFYPDESKETLVLAMVIFVWESTAWYLPAAKAQAVLDLLDEDMIAEMAANDVDPKEMIAELVGGPVKVAARQPSPMENAINQRVAATNAAAAGIAPVANPAAPAQPFAPPPPASPGGSVNLQALAQANQLLQQASAAWQGGNQQGAVQYAQQALQIRQQQLGPQHPKVLEIQQILASLSQPAAPAAAPAPPAATPTPSPEEVMAEVDRLVAQAGEAWGAGDTAGALEAARQAHAHCLQYFGAEHPKTVELQGMLDAAAQPAAAVP